MTLISIFIILVAVPLTFWKPGVGIGLSTQAYILQSSLSGNIIGAEEGDPLLGLLLPMAVFSVVCIKTFRYWFAYKAHVLDWLLLLLGGWLAFSAFLSVNPESGLNISLRYFVLGISFYFSARLLLLIRPSGQNKDTYLDDLLVSIWLVSLLAGLNAFLFLAENSFSVKRLSTGTANPIPFALLVSFGILINTYWLLSANKLALPIKVLLYATVSFLALLLMASQTRSMILGLVVSLPLITINSLRGKGLLTYIGVLVSAIVGLIVIGYGLSVWQPDLFDQWVTRLSLLTSEDKGLSVNARITGYNTAIDLFRKNPLVGVGTGNFANGDYVEGYAHNLTLELASEQGICGLILGCLILFSVFRIPINSKQKNLKSDLLLTLIIFNLVISQFSFTLWQHKNLFLFMALFINQHQSYLQNIRSSIAPIRMAS